MLVITVVVIMLEDHQEEAKGEELREGELP